jgi:DNA invertase Pin-like site-specific DNA recombinase
MKHTTSPTTAIAYVRVSTEDQRLGPEAQRAAIERWAAREGVTVVAWHVDQGVSGAAPIDERPALMAALADVAAHHAGVLVVAKRDRLARDVYAAAILERMVDRAHARIVSAAGEGSDATDPAGMLMRRMVDAFAEYERAMIRSRTKAALQAKRARGERTGGVRFGYDVDAAGKLVPNAREQAIVARVRELRASGRPLRGIVADLEREGVVGRTGRPLALRQVAVIERMA